MDHAARFGNGTRLRLGIVGALRMAQALVGLVVLVAPCGAGAQVTKKFGVIVSKNSGKCVNVEFGNNIAGSRIIQFACDSSANSAWRLEPFGTTPGNNTFRLVVKHSGQCLNVAEASQEAGAKVIQFPCTAAGADNEIWQLEDLGGSPQSFLLRAKHSGMCLNVLNAEKKNGTAVVQSPCNPNAPSNLWHFADSLVPRQEAIHVVSQNSQMCVNVSGASGTSGAPVIQFPCVQASNEKWTFDRRGSGYAIKVQHSGQCLTVGSSSTADNAAVVQSTCQDMPSQIWKPRPSASGGFEMVNSNSGKCLDTSNASTASDAVLVQFFCAGTSSQRWFIRNEELAGLWNDSMTLPLVPAAAASLRTGKVLLWSAFDAMSFVDNTSNTFTAILDPANGTTTTSNVTNTQHDMFCPGTAMLADGQVLVNGGVSNRKTSIFNPTTQTWAAGAEMNIGRGYNADTVLPNGDVFTLGGSWSGDKTVAKIGERWNGTWMTLPGALTAPMIGAPDAEDAEKGYSYRGDNHAWLFPSADNTVFHAGPSAQMNFYFTSGSGSVSVVGPRSDDQYSMNGNAVMFDIGRILKIGGAPGYQNVNAVANAYTINIRGGVNVTKLTPPAFARAFHNSVILPNGKVLVVGGQSRPVAFEDSNPILPAEIWDPATNGFTTAAAMTVPRNYHSVALLLPDARVLVAGGGLCGNCEGNHPDAQIYDPPYMFQNNGTPAFRPIINSAPTSIGYGSTMSVTTNSGVSRFTMVRLSAATHSVNNDQRFIPLSILSSSFKTYTIRTPANASDATPGYYMLFALNSAGGPSSAKIIKLN